MTFDLMIKNARTRFSDGLLDIGIRDGIVHSMGANLSPQARASIDVEGRLVTESFVNGHLHLCCEITRG
jgi:cytosine deaminase